MMKNKDESFNMDCIAEALFSLMQVKDFHDIKIGDIVEKSGLSRVTYFRHFESKCDVLAYKLRRDFRMFKLDNDKKLKQNDTVELFKFHLCYKDTIFSKLTNDEFSYVIMLFTTHQFNGVNLSIKERYELNILTYALIGVMILWKENGFKESPQEIAQYINDYIVQK